MRTARLRWPIPPVGVKYHDAADRRATPAGPERSCIVIAKKFGDHCVNASAIQPAGGASIAGQ